MKVPAVTVSRCNLKVEKLAEDLTTMGNAFHKLAAFRKNELKSMFFWTKQIWTFKLWRSMYGDKALYILGALLEGPRRMMSYKLAPHVLATFTEQVVPIHKHITLFWIPSISGAETVIMKLSKKPVVKLPDNTPISYLFSSLCNCTVFKCQELALNKAPVLLATPNSLLLYIGGDRRDFCLQNRWKFCHTLSF